MCANHQQQRDIQTAHSGIRVNELQYALEHTSGLVAVGCVLSLRSLPRYAYKSNKLSAFDHATLRNDYMFGYVCFQIPTDFKPINLGVAMDTVEKCHSCCDIVIQDQSMYVHSYMVSIGNMLRMI